MAKIHRYIVKNSAPRTYCQASTGFLSDRIRNCEELTFEHPIFCHTVCHRIEDEFAIALWKLGHDPRAEDLDLLLEENFADETDLVNWLRTPCEDLSGLSPVHCIAFGWYNEVVSALETYNNAKNVS